MPRSFLSRVLKGETPSEATVDRPPGAPHIDVQGEVVTPSDDAAQEWPAAIIERFPGPAPAESTSDDESLASDMAALERARAEHGVRHPGAFAVVAGGRLVALAADRVSAMKHAYETLGPRVPFLVERLDASVDAEPEPSMLVPECRD